MTPQCHEDDGPDPSPRNLRLKMTLVIPTVCFGFGFLNALAVGFEKGEAVKLALAWAVSGLTGWGVYNLLWAIRRGRMLAALHACLMGGIHIVRRTAEPWPVLDRLWFGMASTVITVLAVGVVVQVIGAVFDRGEG